MLAWIDFHQGEIAGYYASLTPHGAEGEFSQMVTHPGINLVQQGLTLEMRAPEKTGESDWEQLNLESHAVIVKVGGVIDDDEASLTPQGAR